MFLLSMKPTNRFGVPLLFAVSIFAAGSLRAETAGFPKDKPAFTVEVPAGWKIDYNPAPPSMFLADAELKNSFMVLPMPEGTVISDGASASATLRNFLEQDMKQSMKDETFSEPTEQTVAGQKAYLINSTTKGGGPTNGFLVFTPDGKRYFVGLAGGDAKAVIDSIKAAE
jgi:hypothetical protein